MPNKRKPGSNLGRSIINWEDAFLSYLSFPPEQRSYKAVADKHGISVRTVERHGRTERWKERAREIDRSAANLAAERLRDERAESLLDTEKLIQASMVTLAGQLRAGTVKVRPADLPALHKLRTMLWEQTDGFAEPDPTPTTPRGAGDAIERKRDVLRALDDAGVLQQLLDRNGDVANTNDSTDATSTTESPS